MIKLPLNPPQYKPQPEPAGDIVLIYQPDGIPVDKITGRKVANVFYVGLNHTAGELAKMMVEVFLDQSKENHDGQAEYLGAGKG